MMDIFKLIKPEEILDNTFKLINEDWMLITAGHIKSSETFNTMTASWGGLGILWRKKVAFSFVRPTRHTYKFMEKSDSYTLSFFDEKYRKALTICGSLSGKDLDKVSKAGLTPLEMPQDSVTFNEARMVLVCRKLYFQDLDPHHFLDPSIDENYPKKDYHRMYIGEITSAYIKQD
jgi:flavin reductase (DIM6/NTAB) family NADH-FMN oxidoreductase RutF